MTEGKIPKDRIPGPINEAPTQSFAEAMASAAFAIRRSVEMNAELPESNRAGSSELADLVEKNRSAGHLQSSFTEELRDPSKPISQGLAKPLPPMWDPSNSVGHPGLMPKEEFLARQNAVFQQLTGLDSWKAYQQELAKEDREDSNLVEILQLVVAGLDEEIYNEFCEQKAILEEIELAGKQLVDRIANPSSSMHQVYNSLFINYGNLKAQVNRLEVEFMKMRKARIEVESDRNKVRKAFQEELIKRIKLEQICRALMKKVKELETKKAAIEEAKPEEDSTSSVIKTAEAGLKEKRDQIDSSVMAKDMANTVAFTDAMDELITDLGRKLDTVNPTTKQAQGIKGALKRFLGQYELRRSYFDGQMKAKELECQVYLARADQYKKEASIARARAEALHTQVTELSQQQQRNSSAPQATTVTNSISAATSKLVAAEAMMKEANTTLQHAKAEILNRETLSKEAKNLYSTVASLGQMVKQQDERINELTRMIEQYELERKANGKANVKKPESAPNGSHEKAPNVEKQLKPSAVKEESPKKQETSQSRETESLGKQKMPQIEKTKSNESQELSKAQEVKPNGKQYESKSQETGPNENVLNDEEENSIDIGEVPKKEDEVPQKIFDAIMSKMSEQQKATKDKETPAKSLNNGKLLPEYPTLAKAAEEMGEKLDDNNRSKFVQSLLESCSPKLHQHDENELPETSSAEFFKNTLGFGITGMSFGEILSGIEKHHNSDCEGECLIHQKDHELHQSWQRLVGDFNKYGRTDSRKPLYGPERPPSMRI
ncbi:hypothetical protein TRVA0_075S00232 [Trichomonascus vanleenenianus]|uniref:uncharacterized protein n=1 Tax=Trichomonascus vanleenenianus TaxID=2268995 RepID=UPI003EC97977